MSLRAYAQLARLPALPTALADIGLGALVTNSLPERWASFGLLLCATACLYTAGMVLNDFFDVEQDRRERPERPIPSGRVSRRAAGWLGGVLLAVGMLFAVAADLAPDGADEGHALLSAGLAAGLVAAILLYDGWLKRTPVGPVSMGLCRFLNVLLGMSIAGAIAPEGTHVASIVGLYIVGVTWLARTEARLSHRSALAGAAVLLAASLLLALPLPLQRPAGTSSLAFPYLLVALAFAIGLPILRAIERPSPGPVQAAVGRCLFCLIALDAVLATALVGTGGLVLLVFLIPSLALASRRWLYAT